jgi:hypothetical protein
VKLKKLRDCIRRWEKSLSPDHMSARRKVGSYEQSNEWIAYHFPIDRRDYRVVVRGDARTTIANGKASAEPHN